MLTFIRSTLISFLTALLAIPSYGDIGSYSVLGARNNDLSQFTTRGNEFVSGAQPGSVLMRVNLWGGVGKPGIHHVPAKTNLINLLSYAGGPVKNAILKKVTIKRNTGTENKKIVVNVAEIIEGAASPSIPLEPNDIIVVPEKKPYVSNNTVGLFSVLTMAVTIIATAYYVSQDQQRNN